MSDYKGKFLVGKPLNVLAVVGTVETDVKVDTNYGKIIGISIGETYNRSTELGRINLTLKVDSTERIISCPLTQFLPDGERQMWPIEINEGVNMTAKLEFNIAGLDPSRKIPLVFHTDGGGSCK